MPAATAPPWLEQIDGPAPVLLVAPHGGRRPAASELDAVRPRKVNDLHTPQVTAELARLWGAAAIVNPAWDRNHVDLNRTSQVRRHAPWLLDLLLAAVRRQIAAHGSATVVFVHGWNAIQPACDVGIGARLDDAGGLAAVSPGLPTISRRFLPRLFRFAKDCERRGIAVTFGERYPGAARDNVLQLFTPRHLADADPRVAGIAAEAAAGRVSAVQLELAVPLRWPGAWRAAFLETAGALFADPPSDGGAYARRPPAPREERSRRLALEFHDAAAGVGGFAAIESAAAGRRHGRFLVCLGRARIALFTGEGAPAEDGALACAGMRWTEAPRGIVLDYRGPALLFPRSDPFLDLEEGLAGAELAPLEAHLEWRPGLRAAGNGVGPLSGAVEVAGSRAPISTLAVLDRSSAAGSPPPRWRERRVLHVPLGADHFLSVSSRIESSEMAEGDITSDGVTQRLLAVKVEVLDAPDGLTPKGWRIEVVTRSGPLRIFGQVISVVPVVRPSPEGRVLFFFGLARFHDRTRVGHGTFELARRLPAPA